MRKLFLGFILSAWMGQAMAEDLVCQIKINTGLVSEINVTLAPKIRKMFDTYEGYRFYLNNLGDKKFEVEVYNPADPSRGYAEGFLRTQEDKLGWILWSQDILLDVSCKLQTEK
jgi:hypothetical protein